MRLEDIKEYGSEFFDDRQQNTMIFSIIDILQCEEEDNEEKK